MAAVRKTTTAHLDKSGKIIYKSEWEERRADKDYWLLHETTSERGHLVSAIWSGVIYNAHRIPKSKWAPWSMEVKFVSKTDENGAELDEPTITRDELACESFATLGELENAYNAFIQRYCGATAYVRLSPGKDDPAPPPPPEPPSFEDEEDDDVDDDSGDFDAASKLEEIVEETDAPPAEVDADRVSGGGGGDW